MDPDLLTRFSLNFPGNWIEGEDRDWAGDTQLVLQYVNSEFERAIAAFGLFDSHFPLSLSPRPASSAARAEHLLLDIAARQFVLSVDSIMKLLRQMKKSLDVPEAAKRPIARFEEAFGEIKWIRDSIAHLEDRGRGRNRGNQPIEASVIALGNLVNRRYEYTGEDGAPHGVSISEQTLDNARAILQELLNAYSWK